MQRPPGFEAADVPHAAISMSLSSDTVTQPNASGPKMETVTCNLCGSGEYQPIYRIPDYKYHCDEWFTVVECAKCGLGFVNPRPPRDRIKRYYPSDFYDYFRQDLVFQQQRYAAEARFLRGTDSVNGRPRLLDIGCANGDFPRFMRGCGWEVEGVEVSSNSDPIEDFPVHRADFSSFPGAPRSYDAITAWAVLEHVHDPMAYFLKAGELLRPGGRFVFLVTNLASMSSRHLYMEDVPRHLYFYTDTTIHKYVMRAGMKVERVEYGSSIYRMRPYGCLWYYMLRLMRRRPDWNYLNGVHQQFECWMRVRYKIALSLPLLLRHPGIALSALDFLLAPAIEQFQIWRRNYGIVTWVAIKPGEPGENVS